MILSQMKDVEVAQLLLSKHLAHTFRRGYLNNRAVAHKRFDS